jgi:hypothetical protein
MDEEEWYSSQEEQRPLGPSATRNSDLAAITNRTLYVSLVNHVHTCLRIRTHGHTRQERVTGVGRSQDVWRGGVRNFGHAACS